jgi:hypothetical protein
VEVETREGDDTWFSAFLVLLCWNRMFGFFRLYSETRYLIRMIIEIIFGIGPFLAVFIAATLNVTLAFRALRDQPFVN